MKRANQTSILAFTIVGICIILFLYMGDVNKRFDEISSNIQTIEYRLNHQAMRINSMKGELSEP